MISCRLYSLPVGSSSVFPCVSAAPVAGSSSGCGMVSVSAWLKPSSSRKARRRAGIKVSGPPQNRMAGSISQPRASVPMIWCTTACSTEAAISSRLTFRLIKFWISVLANTPQREAMGCRVVCFSARLLISVTGMFSRAAISSIKAPVPPAQEPFMRISGKPALGKKIILASSPPISISVRTCGYSCLTTSAEATTSWIKGMPKRSLMPMPAEPVTSGRMQISPGEPGSTSTISRRMACRVDKISALCRR